MSEPDGPPTFSLALRSVVDAAVPSGSRTPLLTLVRSSSDARPAPAGARVVHLPTPRRPSDDGPAAA